METLAHTFIYRHTRIGIVTERPAEFIDLTDGLASLVADAAMTVGFVKVQSLHTTTGIAVTGDERPLPVDIADLDAQWPSLLPGCSACLNVVDGRLLLGRDGRVFLLERDGPRPREIAVVMIGQGRR